MGDVSTGPDVERVVATGRGMRAALVSLAVVGLFGCCDNGGRLAPPARWTVRVTGPDPVFSSVVEATTYAAQAWEEATGVQFDVRVEDGGPCGDYGVICVEGVTSIGSEFIGYTDRGAEPWSAHVRVVTTLDQPTLDEVTTHEFGHALHLQHTTGVGDIMGAKADPERRIDADDVAQFRAVYR